MAMIEIKITVNYWGVIIKIYLHQIYIIQIYYPFFFKKFKYENDSYWKTLTRTVNLYNFLILLKKIF